MELRLPYVVVIQKGALFRALSPQKIIPLYWFLYVSKYSKPWICKKKNCENWSNIDKDMDVLMHIGKFYETDSYHRNRLFVHSRNFCNFYDPPNFMNSILRNKYTQKIIDFDRFKMPISMKIFLFCVKKKSKIWPLTLIFTNMQIR